MKQRSATQDATSPAREPAQANLLPAAARPRLRRSRSGGIGRGYVLAFSLPVLILALAYFCCGFYPLGERTPLTIDLYHQYAPFMSELQDKLRSGGSLFYSWNMGLGQNFYALYAYYLASPFNWLLPLFPASGITDAVLIFTLAKVGLMGLGFFHFLLHSFASQPRSAVNALGLPQLRPRYRSQQVGDYLALTLSLAYALSSYALAYSWNLMWLDVLVCLPLMLRGLHRVFEGRSSLLFSLSLALALLSNYYCAFFACLFCFCYAQALVWGCGQPRSIRLAPGLSRILRRGKKSPDSEQGEAELASPVQAEGLAQTTQETGPAQTEQGAGAPPEVPHRLSRPSLVWTWLCYMLRMALASLLGIGLSAVLLLPSLRALSLTSAAGDQFPTNFQLRFSLLDFLTKALSFSKPDIRDGFPNIYAGLFLLLLLPLYFFNRRIPKRERKSFGLLLLFLYFSFNLNVLDFIWHGLHYPNQIPYRFAFVYVALVLVLAFRSFQHIRGWRRGLQSRSFALAALALVLLETVKSERAGHWQIYTCLGLLFCYQLLLRRLRRSHKAARRWQAWTERREERGEEPVPPKALPSKWRRRRREALSFRYYSFCLALLVCLDLSLNAIQQVQQISENEYYTRRQDFIQQIEPVRQIVQELEQSDQDFWRMELLPQMTSNAPALYGYRGLSLFSSTSGKSQAVWMRQLGYQGNNINSYLYTASTRFLDSFFGLRYLLSKDRQLRNGQLEALGKSGDYYRYKNGQALPLALAVPQRLAQFQASQIADPFRLQESLATELTGQTRSLYRPIKVELLSAANYSEEQREQNSLKLKAGSQDQAGLVHLKIKAEQKALAYLYLRVEADTELSWRLEQPLEGDAVEAYKLSETRSVGYGEYFSLPELDKDQTLLIDLKTEAGKSRAISIYAVQEETELVNQTLSQLQAQGQGGLSVQDGRIEGEVRVEEGQSLLLTMPEDPSWEVWVNGSPSSLKALDGGLSLLELSPGRHSIRLRYLPNGFRTGLLLTVLSALCVLLLCFWERRYKVCPAGGDGGPAARRQPGGKLVQPGDSAGPGHAPEGEPGPSCLPAERKLRTSQSKNF